MENINLTELQEAISVLNFWLPAIIGVILTGAVVVLFNGLRRNI